MRAASSVDARWSLVVAEETWVPGCRGITGCSLRRATRGGGAWEGYRRLPATATVEALADLID